MGQPLEAARRASGAFINTASHLGRARSRDAIGARGQPTGVCQLDRARRRLFFLVTTDRPKQYRQLGRIRKPRRRGFSTWQLFIGQCPTPQLLKAQLCRLRQCRNRNGHTPASRCFECALKYRSNPVSALQARATVSVTAQVIQPARRTAARNREDVRLFLTSGH